MLFEMKYMAGLGRLCGIFVATTALAAVPSAQAAEASSTLTDTLALDPPEWNVGDVSIKLGGYAAGALFASHQSGGPAYPAYNHQDASGEARADVRVQRIFDTGLILGANGEFLVYRDKFSGDEYDNDTVE